jgi:signal peptidase II
MNGPPAPPSPPHRARTVALLALVVACVACDQGTKRIAVSYLVPGERLSLLGDTVRLELAHNPGAFLSMGGTLGESTRRLLFTWGAGLVALGALCVALHRGSRARTALAAALVAGGGAGNLWDRIASDGHVIDFLNAGLGRVRTGIFNVADVALMAAALLLVLPRRHAEAADSRNGG